MAEQEMGGSESNLTFDDLGFESPTATEVSHDSNQGSPTIDDFNNMDEARQETHDAKKEELEKLKGKTSEDVNEITDEEDKEEDAEKGEPGEEEESDDESEQEAKFFKSKVGDKDIDVDESTMLPVKVNGQESMISVRDLINDYSGKTNYDRMYSEFDKEKKSFQGDMDSAKTTNAERENMLESFSNTLKEKGSVEALKKHLDYFQTDKYTFMKGLRDTMAEDLEEYLMMSPDQQESHDLKMENEYLKEKDESSKSQLDQAEAVKGVNDQIAKATEKFGFTREDFSGAMKELKDADKLSDDVTVDQLTDYISDNKAIDSSINLLKGIDESHVRGEDAGKTISEVAKLYKSVQAGEMTEEEVKTLVFEVLEVDETTAKELSEKLGNSDKEQSKKKNKKIKEEVFFDFDHLD